MKKNKIIPFDISRIERIQKTEINMFEKYIFQEQHKCEIFLSKLFDKKIKLFSSESTEEKANTSQSLISIKIKNLPYIHILIDNNFLNKVIEKILGGTTSREFTTQRGEDYSKIEICLIKKIFKSIIQSLNNEIKLEKIDIDSCDKSYNSKNEFPKYKLKSFKIHISSSIFFFKIFIPTKVINLFNSKNKQVGSNSKTINNHLLKMEVDLIGFLGEAEIQVEDILNFSIGDIIQLDNKFFPDVAIKVNGKILFRGELGTSKKHSAIEIKAAI